MVKILQITAVYDIAANDIRTFGLGEDNKVYEWSGEWILDANLGVGNEDTSEKAQ